MRGKTYAPDVKAAVIAAILLGEEIKRIAREHQVSESTVLDWQRQLRASTELVRSEKTNGDSLGDLVANYLQRSLNTLAIQADFFSDRAWLEKQSAADAAILHGVLMDKAVRVLGALERSGEQLPDGSTVVDTTARTTDTGAGVSG